MKGIDLTGAKVLGINLGDVAGKPAKRSKYGAIRTTFGLWTYDSKIEAEHAKYLAGCQQIGVVDWWKPKPGAWPLGDELIRFYPDFLVIENGRLRIDEVKGVRTPKFKLIAKLWRKHGDMPMHVITGKNIEIITPEHLL